MRLGGKGRIPAAMPNTEQQSIHISIVQLYTYTTIIKQILPQTSVFPTNVSLSIQSVELFKETASEIHR